jgi:hypothetical protein
MSKQQAMGIVTSYRKSFQFYRKLINLGRKALLLYDSLSANDQLKLEKMLHVEDAIGLEVMINERIKNG